MTITVANLLYILLIESAFLLYIAKSMNFDLHYFKRFTVINMLIIFMFASKLFTVTILGYTLVTNITSVCFAFISVSQLIILRLYGGHYVRYGVKELIYSSILFLLLANAITGFPVLNVDDLVYISLYAMVDSINKAAIMSILSISLSLTFATYLYDNIKHRYSDFVVYSVTILFLQILDSLIFFNLMFYGALTFKNLYDVMFVGMLVKSSLCILLYPVYKIGILKEIRI